MTLKCKSEQVCLPRPPVLLFTLGGLGIKMKHITRSLFGVCLVPTDFPLHVISPLSLSPQPCVPISLSPWLIHHHHPPPTRITTHTPSRSSSRVLRATYFLTEPLLSPSQLSQNAPGAFKLSLQFVIPHSLGWRLNVSLAHWARSPKE